MARERERVSRLERELRDEARPHWPRVLVLNLMSSVLFWCSSPSVLVLFWCCFVLAAGASLRLGVLWRLLP